MKNIRKFLYFCAFNCIGVMPMYSQLVRNATATDSSNAINNNTLEIHGGKIFNSPYASTNGNLAKKTKPTKQVSSSGLRKTLLSKQEKTCDVILRQKQENNNILLNEIRDIIDRKHLQINTDDLFRRMIGTFWSSYKAYSLTHEQATEELDLIQSYILVEDKEYFLQKLEERHYYVSKLLQIAVYAKAEEIQNNIKGSTIDAFFYPPKHNGFKRMVQVRALEKYFSRLENMYWLMLPLRNGEKNPHAAVLYGNRQSTIKENSLAISSDSKYLRAFDDDGKEIIWDMETGRRTELTGWDRIQWHYDGWGGDDYGKRYVWDYHRARSNTAVLVDAKDIKDAATLGIDLGGWENKAVVLYKSPDEATEIVLEAFERSSTKVELLKLLSSKTLAAIKGFPREKITDKIQAKIDKL